MSMKVTLDLRLDVELFQLEEVARAEKHAQESGGVLYCWKTSGRENWLDQGLSLVDVVGIIVLPHRLPDPIDMPNDEAEEGDEKEEDAEDD